MPRICLLKIAPIWANCTKWLGRQSTLAPASISSAGVDGVMSIIQAIAGRSIPSIFPRPNNAAPNTAPVLPAEINDEALPSFTRFIPTTIEEFGLLRIAFMGDSLYSII